MSAYKPQVGDTVRSDVGSAQYTVKLGPDSDGYWLIEDTDGEWTLETIGDGHWVKVEPTPADRYLVFRANGAQVNPVLDRLREMFGIEATDVEGVFEALEKYDAAMHRSAFGRRPDGDARCSECAGRLWVACSECGRPS